MLLRRRNFLAGALGLPFIAPGAPTRKPQPGLRKSVFVYEGPLPAPSAQKPSRKD